MIDSSICVTGNGRDAMSQALGFVNLDWPHCAHLFWPHLVGVWGVESRVWSVGVEGCAVDGGEAAVALLGAGAGCAEEVSDLGPRAVLVSGVGDGSG